MKQSLKDYKRIVIKIGSSLMYSDKGKLDLGFVNAIVSQIAGLVREGKEVIIVSSGAIALGMSVLRLEDRPKELAYLQAAAAVGQHELMDAYRRFFRSRKLNCAQLLLTWEDFNDHKRYLNAKNTLLALFKMKGIPVINENDTVSTDEIKFGDNDRLSALVASLVGADLLIILSDVEGLLGADKKTVVRLVEKITPAIKALACPTSKKTCVGGMITKIEAANIAVSSGIPCVIASGRRKDIITSCVKESGAFGTIFLPKNESLAEKERWIAFSARPKGRIIVDDGARSALENKKSLLAVGVISAEGDFAAGDIVSIRDSKAHEFARGRAGISSKELENIKGAHHEKEVAHRDNIVVF